MIILFLLSFLVASSTQGMELQPVDKPKPKFENGQSILERLPFDIFSELTQQITQWDISDASYALRALACTNKQCNKLINNDQITKLYVQSLINSHIDFFNGKKHYQCDRKEYDLSTEQQYKTAVSAVLIGTKSTKRLHTPYMFKPEFFNRHLENGHYVIDENGYFKRRGIDLEYKNVIGTLLVHDYKKALSCFVNDNEKGLSYLGNVNPIILFFLLKHKKHFIYSHHNIYDNLQEKPPVTMFSETKFGYKILYQGLILDYFVQTGQNKCLTAFSTDNEMTLLAYAIANRLPEQYIKTYLKYVDINSIVEHYEGQSPLHVATHNSNCTMVDYLLQEGADPEQTDLKKYMSPLHYAAVGGCLHCVKAVYNRTKNIDPKTRSNSTPLIFAIGHYKFQVAKYLLENCSNPNVAFKPFITLKKFPKNDIRYIGSTALSWLITNNIIKCHKRNSILSDSLKKDKDLLKVLIKYNADPNIPRSDSFLPLHFIVNNKLYSTYNPDDFYYEDHKDKLPLEEQYEIAKILIDGGANRNNKDRYGRTPLMLFLATYTYATISNKKSHLKFKAKEKLRPEQNSIVLKIISLLTTPENVFDVDPDNHMNLQDYLDYLGIEPTPQIIQAQQQSEKRNSMNVFASWALGTTALIALKFFTQH